MIFAAGLTTPETPVFLGDGRLLVVETETNRGTVSLIDADGTGISVLAHTGRPNGVALDLDGALWVAESLEPSLLRIDRTGDIETVATGTAGGPFLFPNDLCFGADGQLYLTDSGFRREELWPGGIIRPDFATMPYDGRLYAIDPRSREIRVLDRGLRFANGIAVGLAGELFVSETITGRVSRYRPVLGGGFAPRETFGNVFAGPSTETLCGPDGMAVGSDGSLYVAVWGAGEVAILDRDGVRSSEVRTGGRLPSNVAFGPDGEPAIYVTEMEHGTVERHDVATGGAIVHHGRVS